MYFEVAIAWGVICFFRNGFVYESFVSGGNQSYASYFCGLNLNHRNLTHLTRRALNHFEVFYLQPKILH